MRDELVQVFDRMLEPDPELRPTAAEVMQMAYFKKWKALPKIGTARKIPDANFGRSATVADNSKEYEREQSGEDK